MQLKLNQTNLSITAHRNSKSSQKGNDVDGNDDDGVYSEVIVHCMCMHCELAMSSGERRRRRGIRKILAIKSKSHYEGVKQREGKWVGEGLELEWLVKNWQNF